jgi:ubiquinone/menaquinone biosynthesis C-methylase UbiE
MRRDADTIRQFFDANADGYEARIVPAFRHFAESVIRTAQPLGHEVTLDIGTGTGILARLIASRVRHVTGIDFAPAMIEQAILTQNANVIFQVADVHELPFEADTFHLGVASFGLNATRPRRAFAELHRVLKPEGVLAFHEWNVLHRLDDKIIEVFARYMVDEDDAPPHLLKIRHFIRTPRLWDNILQEADDFKEVLAETGYVEIQVWEDAPVEVVMPVADFMDYKLAWANRQAELAAMDEFTRKDCLDALRSMLQDEVGTDGNIHYAPLLFRVRAKKG